MIIQTTKKLQTFLSTNGVPLPERINDFACWHGNILTINRRKVLLLTHNKSYYSILLYGITKKEMPTLQERIRETLKRQLMQDDFTIAQIEEMLRNSKHFSFFKSSERKVLGTMNDMAVMIESWILQDKEVNEVEISNMLNGVPYKARDFIPAKSILKPLIENALLFKAMHKN